MGTLYVDRAGLELRVQGGAIELRVEGERLRSLPAALVERVVLRADTRLSSAGIVALAEAGVGLVAQGGRGGQRVAHVLGRPANDCRARIAQCRRLGDEVWASAWARRIVEAKLGAQLRLLRAAQAQRPDLRKPLRDAAATLQAVRTRCAGAADRAALRGLEGAGAAAYFRAYTALFADALGFTARRRRPPPDPVNACLSLGYTLAHAQAVQACWATGLDPMVGLMHLPAFGRESLACDLVEPWRAQVDAWVWQQFRERLLRPEHFGRDGAGACLLGKAGRSHFYAAFTPLQQLLGRALRRHAQLAARALAGACDVPFEDLVPESAGEEDESAAPAAGAA
ncbi:MAG: CRISPR-associated endonuclease Cas1 [Rubrivivax sp.]